MSEENVGIVRRFIGAFNRGGVEAALPFVDREIEWNTTGIFVKPGTYRGHEGVVRYLGDAAPSSKTVHTEPEHADRRRALPVRVAGLVARRAARDQVRGVRQATAESRGAPAVLGLAARLTPS